MGRSQRHKVYIQNAASNGVGEAEGQLAPGFILQGEENYAVVEGPDGGPLEGSTIIGAIPPGLEPVEE